MDNDERHLPVYGGVFRGDSMYDMKNNKSDKEWW